MPHPDWVQHLSIQLDPAVTFDHIPASHRGVFAHSPLPTDHIFARIPFSALINVEHALVDPELGAVLERNPSIPDPVCTALLLAQLQLRGDSQWTSYLSWLPTELHTPVLWETDQLKLLEGTSLLIEVHRRKSRIRELHNQVLRAQLPQPLRISESELSWWLAILRSRLFGVDIQDGAGEWHHTHSLVPFADALNTAPQPNTACWTEMSSREFVCGTSRPVTAGEELTAPYGELLSHVVRCASQSCILPSSITNATGVNHTNRDYFLDYGFVSPQFEHLTVPVELLGLQLGDRASLRQALTITPRRQLLAAARKATSELGDGASSEMATDVRARYAHSIRHAERSTLGVLVERLERLEEDDSTQFISPSDGHIHHKQDL